MISKVCSLPIFVQLKEPIITSIIQDFFRLKKECLCTSFFEFLWSVSLFIHKFFQPYLTFAKFNWPTKLPECWCSILFLLTFKECSLLVIHHATLFLGHFVRNQSPLTSVVILSLLLSETKPSILFALWLCLSFMSVNKRSRKISLIRAYFLTQ